MTGILSSVEVKKTRIKSATSADGLEFINQQITQMDEDISGVIIGDLFPNPYDLLYSNYILLKIYTKFNHLSGYIDK